MSDKLQAQWEKRLKKLGLGVYQPMTDNSEGETAPTTGGETDAYAQLRTGIDGSDLFMEAFQITKVRTIQREIPEWALSNRKVQQILKTAFPRMTYKDKRAGRWARIIYLYYRMELPRQIVAREIGITEAHLNRTLQAINWVAAGRRSDGKPRKVVSPPTPREGLGERGDETK
jgi:hypothetical protein